MNNYFDNLDTKVKQYFNILSEEIPEFLYDYIDTPEMQKQAGISVSCGNYYTKMNDTIWFSSLDHSVGVALIIWNFTKDKKQTLAGLFHDIATPAFKHCVDFLNGDYSKQESTEELTYEIIANSKQIMQLLKRDNIQIEEVADYKIYPIADNDSPKLSSDRLEYTLSNGLGAAKKIWKLNDIEEIYKDIEIKVNENGEQELGFKRQKIAEKFVQGMSILSSTYVSSTNKFTMQFLADVIKKMNEDHLITVSDLYKFSEKEIIEKIENCNKANLSKCFKYWENSREIKESDVKPVGKYFVSIDNVKVRIIDPIAENSRISTTSDVAKCDLLKAMNFKTPKYIYLDFNLEEKELELER